MRNRYILLLDFPAAGLDTVPHREVNAALQRVFAEARPELGILPADDDALPVDSGCRTTNADPRIWINGARVELTLMPRVVTRRQLLDQLAFRPVRAGWTAG